MKSQKFEQQDYYQAGIFDSRVLGVLSTEGASEHPVYEFVDQPLPLAEFQGRGSLSPRRSTDQVNGLTMLAYRGLDGELNSGFIDLAQIDSAHGRSAAIRAYSHSNETGLPLDGMSWICEFDSVDQAQEFWLHSWRPNFNLYTIQDALAYAVNRGDIDPVKVRLYELGMLRPWYARRPQDRLLLGRYATRGDDIIVPPSSAQPSPRFTVGQVYKVPEAQPYWDTRDKWSVKTCLGAFVASQAFHVYGGRELGAATYIQWDDGSLRHYVEGSERHFGRLPEPLTSADLKPVRKASAA